MRKVGVLLMALSFACFASAAPADWNLGDPHKMHFPQLPDEDGWDVSWYNAGYEPIELADDWVCTQSGPVTDIHIWFSAKEDLYSGMLDRFNICVRIYSDNPDGGQGYSVPDQFLWGWTWNEMYPDPGNVAVRPDGAGDQGWWWPGEDFIQHDHADIWQLNLTELADHSGMPFEQVAGEVYWLNVHISTTDQFSHIPDPAIGWKTADVDRYPENPGQHFRDDAVWYDQFTHQWQELRDPITGESLDLAFVITPEPATVALLAVGAVALLRKRR